MIPLDHSILEISMTVTALLLVSSQFWVLAGGVITNIFLLTVQICKDHFFVSPVNINKCSLGQCFLIVPWLNKFDNDVYVVQKLTDGCDLHEYIPYFYLVLDIIKILLQSQLII